MLNTLLFVTVTCTYLLRSLRSSTAKMLYIQKSVCSSRDLIYLIQREQIRKAREEVFQRKSFSNGSLSNFSKILNDDRDLRIYFHHFDTLEVDIKKYSKNYDVLVYYRIYKNANDNIRTLLYNFEKAKKTKFRNIRFFNCVATDQCSHPTIGRISEGKLQYLSFFTHDHDRFAFSFVREPLRRFISSITEV